MSILSVANVHFDTDGTNRIEYLTANGLLNLVTTGNIAISSRNFTLSNTPGPAGNVLTSNGSTWVSQAQSINLSSQVTDVLGITNGGTGISSPGSAGNVLTSNGTAWVSQLPGISVTDELNSESTYYVTLSIANTGISSTNVSSTKLYYTPNTGTLSATNFNTLSDLNYKKDVLEISDALNKLDQLTGVTFTWRENNQKSMGVLAQDVETVAPELVTDNNGRKSVNYDGLIGLIIQSIKELKNRIEKLESK